MINTELLKPGNVVFIVVVGVVTLFLFNKLFSTIDGGSQ